MTGFYDKHWHAAVGPGVFLLSTQDLAWIKELIDEDDRAVLHMAKKVWDRDPVPPLYALDRPHVATGKAPPVRLVQLVKRITRPDQPGLVYFDASHMRWDREAKWWVYGSNVVTGPARLGVIWGAPPTLPEWSEARKRIRLAAQLGAYIVATLPSGYVA